MGKTAFFSGGRLEKKEGALKNRYNYYPFGLTFNSYKREFSKKNKMNTFQDQEYEEETGWVKFKWRNHDPAIGRFFNIDPLAEDYYYNSPYAFSENDVISAIELEGLEKIRVTNYSAIQSEKLKESLNNKSRIEQEPVSSSNSRRTKLNKLSAENKEINRIMQYGANNGFGDDFMVDKLNKDGISVPNDVKNGETTLQVEVIDPEAELSFEIYGVGENKDGKMEVSKLGDINESEEEKNVNIETAEEVGKIVIQNAADFLLLRFLKYPVEFNPLPTETGNNGKDDKKL